MKAQWLNRNLVDSPVYLTLCTSSEMFDSKLRRLKIAKSDRPPFISEFANATTHFFVREGKEAAIVCILPETNGIDGIQIAAILVHEAVHIWQETRRILGETNPSSEFEAYSIQAISQRLMYEFARQTSKVLSHEE